MTEFYSPISGPESVPRQRQPAPKNYTSWFIALGVVVVICLVVLVAFIFIYFRQPSASAEVQKAAAASGVSQPTMQLRDDVFLYDGQVVLDGQVHNVSIRIDGITTEDAVKIVKAYVGI